MTLPSKLNLLFELKALLVLLGVFRFFVDFVLSEYGLWKSTLVDIFTLFTVPPSLFEFLIGWFTFSN